MTSLPSPLSQRAPALSELRAELRAELLWEGAGTGDPAGYAAARLESRLAQAELLASLPATLLCPPSFLPPRPQRVWYASYGSNMSAERFSFYLQGGTPPGAARCYEGARDASPPGEAVGLHLPGAVHFALTSRVWGGGIAFLDILRGRSLGRAYRLSFEQFEEVYAQENRLPVGTPVDLASLSALVPPSPARAYSRLLHLGDLAGDPVLAFTSFSSAADAAASRTVVEWMGERVPFSVNSPIPLYLRMLASGVEETFGLGSTELSTYFSGMAGAPMVGALLG